MPTDPVCGMEVKAEKAAGKTEYKGDTYYFCATACQVNIDKGTCIGSATCVGLCGEVFEMGGKGKANITGDYRGDSGDWNRRDRTMLLGGE